MRPVYACGLVAVALPVLMAAASVGAAPSPSNQADVTVVLDIKGVFAPAALREMEREASQIIGASGIRLGWLLRSEASSAVFNDLVVMTFRGSCALDPLPASYNETGPFAFTRTENGKVQPFGDVDCGHVVGTARQAMFGDDSAHSDTLIGRALGRVVAHELFHMLTRSALHGTQGVEKAALSGRELIAPSLQFGSSEIERLRQLYARPVIASNEATTGTDTPAESGSR